MYENIIVERSGEGIALVQLNRPKRLNALNQQTMREIAAALTELADDDDVRVVVLAGNERAFAAGADVTEMLGTTSVDMLQSYRFKQWEVIWNYPKPLIAAVSGWCLGGGNELAMSCDMIVASESARFGQPEIRLAIMPGAGGTQRLTRAVGKAVAMEMVLGSRFLEAEEARELGLVNHVVPTELYLEKAMELAREVASKSPIALQLAKEAVLKALELPLDEGLEFERKNFYHLFATEDKDEGISAFLDKREPEWKGK